MERLEAIRDACGPDFGVTVDPNQRFYRLDDAWPTLRAMDEVGNLHIIEDAFPRTALPETAELRRRINARVVIHIDPPEMLTTVLRSDAVGGLNLESPQGWFNWRMQAAAADQMNLPIWLGGGNDCGIATAMQLQAASSTPNCTLPGDHAGPWLREHHLLQNDFRIFDGAIEVPTGPGLGVEPDLDALENYTVEQTTIRQ